MTCTDDGEYDADELVWDRLRDQAWREAEAERIRREHGAFGLLLADEIENGGPR